MMNKTTPSTRKPNQSRRHQKRQAHFQRWWAKNHSSKKAHTWLAHYTRNITHAYMLAPEAYEQIISITKRFFSSEFRKLSGKDAYQLWRLSHPVTLERSTILAATAQHLLETKLKIHEQGYAKYQAKKASEVQVTVKKSRKVTP